MSVSKGVLKTFYIHVFSVVNSFTSSHFYTKVQCVPHCLVRF